MKEFNFSKKRKAQVYMIITTMLLCISSCAFSNFDTYADDNFNYSTAYDFANINYLEYEDTDEAFQFAHSQAITECQYLIDNDLFTCPSSYAIDTETFPKYAIIYNSSNHRFYVMYADENAFLTVNRSYSSSGYINLNSSNFDGNFRYRISRWKYDGNSSGYIESLDDFTNSNPDSYHVYETSESNTYDVFYSCSLFGYQIVASTVPIYVEDAPSRNGTDLYLDEVDNINGTISDTSNGGTSSNHLVMTNSNFNFQNSSYTAPYSVSFNTGNVYPSGSVSYTFDLDEYQEEHQNEFYLTFLFSFDLDMNYKYYAGNSVLPATSALLNNKKNYKSQFTYYDSENDTMFVDVPLTTFVNNGYSISMKDIFDNCSNGSFTLTNFLNQCKEVDLIEYNKFNINATCVLNNSKGESSGNYAEWYNPMNKKGFTTDKSAEINKNEYTGSNGNDVVDTGSGAGGTAGVNGDNSNNIGGGTQNNNNTSSANNGGVTINNNNNFNPSNSNSGGGYGDVETSESALSFYATFNPMKFLINLIVGENTSTGEEIVDDIGVNNWFSVIADTYSFIPQAVWTQLTTMMITVIGILVIAFIIRVVLDLL